MNRSFLVPSKFDLVAVGILGLINLGCTKITIYPTTPLQGTTACRLTVRTEGKTEYEYVLKVPNKDGSLIWSAVSEEPILITIAHGKPSTLISWRVSEARMKSLKRFELSLYLASAGPEPIKVSVPTYQDVNFGFPPIPIPHL